MKEQKQVYERTLNIKFWLDDKDFKHYQSVLNDGIYTVQQDERGRIEFIVIIPKDGKFIRWDKETFKN